MLDTKKLLIFHVRGPGALNDDLWGPYAQVMVESL